MNDKYEEGFIPFAYIDETEDDFCEYCGRQLVHHREQYPYGDTFVYECLIMCPNCD